MKKLEYLAPKWNAPKSVQAIFTTRQGGVSAGAYASLNLSYAVGDNQEHVSHNRRSLDKALPSTPVWIRQVHGSKLVLAEDANPNTEADALYTNKQRTVCGIMTADCLPVLITNTKGDEVAVAHAGWRGLAAGILETTVKGFYA